MKRHLTSVLLVLFLAGFSVCGYFVSPIFIDMLVLLFMAGAVYEMRKCLKDAGYDMYISPIVLMLVCAYPTFYLMQHFVGGSCGVQGLLIVILVSFMLTLSIFTFKPSVLKMKAEKAKGRAAITSESEEETVSSEMTESTTEVSEVKNEIPVPSAKSGLGSLFANIFTIVYPMIFLTVAWIVSYKYSALFAVLFAILVPIIGSDMFAYIVGKSIGGKKLCPSISPKKTIAGAIGGLFGGMILAIIFWVVFEYVGYKFPEFAAGCSYVPFFAHSVNGWMWKSALVYLAIGLVCGAVSELGDLAASRIKRELGIKDYGKIFPGHGGFLDRIDSVMYCLVILLIVFTCIYGG